MAKKKKRERERERSVWECSFFHFPAACWPEWGSPGLWRASRCHPRSAALGMGNWEPHHAAGIHRKHDVALDCVLKTVF